MYCTVHNIMEICYLVGPEGDRSDGPADSRLPVLLLLPGRQNLELPVGEGAGGGGALPHLALLQDGEVVVAAVQVA